MDTGLLHLHNFLRWVILILLVASIFKAYSGWQQKKLFTAADKKLWLFTMIAAHITLLVGLYQWLFGRYGLISKGVLEGIHIMKDKYYRFFLVEHPTGMIISIILITLGYGMAKKQVADETKFRKAFWYFIIALVVILITVPWPFRQIVGRPLLPGMH